VSDTDREHTVRVAEKIERFMQDEDIREVLARVERRYIEEMIASDDNLTKSKAQDKIRAIRDFAKELTAGINNGVHELALAEIATKRREYLKKEGLFFQQ